MADDDAKRCVGKLNGIRGAASVKQAGARVARGVLVQARARSIDIAECATDSGDDIGASDGDRVRKKQSLEPRRQHQMTTL
jgi:hypothetical protein